MKLNTKRTVYVGFAFLLICMFWGVYDAVIPKMLVNTFGLNQTWSGVIMALDNVLALFLLPIFGTLSDKTKNKRGRRTPFIIIGTITAAVLVTGVALIDFAQLNEITANGITPVLRANFETQEAFDAAWATRQSMVAQVTQSNIFLLVAFIGVLLLVLIAMATFRSPAVALMPDVTPKPLRSQANAIINLMGTAGGIIALGLMAVLSKDFKEYVLLFAVLAVLMLVFLALFLWKVNEPKLVETMHQESEEAGYVVETVEEDEKKGIKTGIAGLDPKVKKSFFLILFSVFFWFMAYNAATTKYSLYAQNVLGMGYTLPLLVAQAAAVVAFIPIGKIASKFGRRKTILAGVVILVVAFVIGSFLNVQTRALSYVVMALAGIGWATINVNSYPMVVEMGKEGDVGKFTGYYYTASMAAQIITPILSGAFMDLAGTMTVLFPYCAILAAVAFVTMFFVKHGDSKPIPKKKALENFDNPDD
ncbi:MAG: MFS transporter [Bacilli bacterium]|nr:MFS transporter [Bacilli bacterium]MDD4065546.1 MFS transporter [Bacilli bacterium]